MTTNYAILLLVYAMAALSVNAEPIACPGNDINICNTAFAAAIMDPNSGVQSASCIADKCIALCKQFFNPENGGESCVPKHPGGSARGKAQQVACPGNNVGFCNDAFAPGYVSSGVASVACEEEVCRVTCRRHWTQSVDRHYCQRGATINICKNYETADELDATQPECKCWAATLVGATATTRGCPPGQTGMTAVGAADSKGICVGPNGLPVEAATINV